MVLRHVYTFMKTTVMMTVTLMGLLYVISAVYLLIYGEFKGPTTYPEFIRCLEIAIETAIIFACAEAFFRWVRYLKQKELEEEANSNS